jgi:hypothetical protein
MKQFEKRLANPEQFGFFANPDGSVSTHLMRAEVDELGRAWAFPMIVQDGVGLRRFDDPQEAMMWNIQHGNAKPFNDIQEALDFSKNYKTDAFIEHYRKAREGKQGLLSNAKQSRK